MSCEINKITEHTWILSETIDETIVPVYMYLLEGEKEALLIDTGYGSFDLRKTVSELTGLPVTVLLTHGHLDHIGACAQFDKVLLHKDDIDCYRLHCSEKERSFFSLDEGFPYPKSVPELIDEHWQTDLGKRKISLIHAPGHTPGCICVLDQDKRLLFSGDVSCKGNVLLCMKYSLSVNDYVKGIGNILKREKDFDQIWPSHHEKPLDKTILYQFIEAAELILSNREKGEELYLHGVKNYELKYQDIGILYTAEGQKPLL